MQRIPPFLLDVTNLPHNVGLSDRGSLFAVSWFNRVLPVNVMTNLTLLLSPSSFHVFTGQSCERASSDCNFIQSCV